jgi:hypothetical protein
MSILDKFDELDQACNQSARFKQLPPDGRAAIKMTVRTLIITHDHLNNLGRTYESFSSISELLDCLLQPDNE